MQKINLAIFTTFTPHHQYFITQIQKLKPKWLNIKLVIYEKKKFLWHKYRNQFFKKSFPNLFKGIFFNPYIQLYFLENIIQRYEKKNFFEKSSLPVIKNLLIKHVKDINNLKVKKNLIKNKIHLVFVYGTGKIKPEIYNVPKYGALNAHGGYLPKYRGLDTNLWAIYKKKYSEVVAAIHKVDKDFDTGPILIQKSVKHNNDLSLFNLRYYTTLLITKIAVPAIERLLKKKYEKKEGNDSSYYKPMPILIKLIVAIKLFLKY